MYKQELLAKMKRNSHGGIGRHPDGIPIAFQNQPFHVATFGEGPCVSRSYNRLDNAKRWGNNHAPEGGGYRITNRITEELVGEWDKGLLPSEIAKRAREELWAQGLCRCTKCLSAKPFSAFGLDTRKKNGLKAHCLACEAAYTMAYRKAHPRAARRYCDLSPQRKAKKLAAQKRYRKANPHVTRGWQRANRDKNRLRLNQWMTDHGCHDCGDKRVVVLVFHHLKSDPSNVSVPRLVNSTWEKIEAEIDKCHLLCANCHMIRHWGLRQKKETKKAA